MLDFPSILFWSGRFFSFVGSIVGFWRRGEVVRKSAWTTGLVCDRARVIELSLIELTSVTSSCCTNIRIPMVIDVQRKTQVKYKKRVFPFW